MILPSTLPILPLESKVLLPSIVTDLMLSDDDARRIGLTDEIYIVCVPLTQQQTHGVHRQVEGDVSRLFHYGCTAKVLAVDRTLPHALSVRVQGVCRSSVEDVATADSLRLEASLIHHVGGDLQEDGLDGLAWQLRGLCKDYVTRLRVIGIPEAILFDLERRAASAPISSLVDWLLCVTETTLEEKLKALETVDLASRLETGIAVHFRIEQTVDQQRRGFYLRHQVHLLAIAIPSDDDDEELVELVQNLNDCNLPEEARNSVSRDIKRLRKMAPSSPESGVLRAYLELVAALPWHKRMDDVVNISEARDRLDADHYGLELVKRRILEYLAVIKVKQDLSPPILCLVGPPGVGKTTLARSIATALRRKFQRISLGSIRDEADIRGHRRTYVASMPGLLISGMRKCGVKNPVILLDEIDKMVKNSSQGDPAAAMLEVLDPAQSSTFVDHFLNIPFDLSQVLFIATANSMESIPDPLLDRMEVVHLEGYTVDEKVHIAKSYLWPKQLAAHGLDDLVISDAVLQYICETYTQESGVRNLDRCVASLCRYKCREYADLMEAGRPHAFRKTIERSDIQRILGLGLFERETVMDDEDHAMSGVVSGLAYSQSGLGDVLQVETTLMAGRGRLTLTGNLGDVIKESAYIAVSWVKANAYALKLTRSRKEELLENTDIHIHVPNGAVPKDGPSAGITMAMSLISVLMNKAVSGTTAMTGEITLRGQVRPVGGIKEKVLSAHRAGIRKIILPARNRRDVEADVAKTIIQDIELVYVRTIWDALEATQLLVQPTDVARPIECRL
ncbi:ATP-dependent protease La [Dichotomocladium elegans]|nr:ATP-dependent protease La [Dichotomocladium elegans]